jgi:hypothetical protein
MIKKRDRKKDMSVNKLDEYDDINDSKQNVIIPEKTIIEKLMDMPIPASTYLTKYSLHKTLTNSITYSFKYSLKHIDATNFDIPRFDEYDNLISHNYNLKQLKSICKSYILKISGNKEILKKRIYNYLFYSHFTIIVQKYARLLFVKKYIRLHGPAFANRALCTNDVDFCTLDDMKTIPYNQFISFRDANDFIYGYDILSLYNLYIKKSAAPENPFNKTIIPKEVFDNLMYYIRMSKILNIPTDINYNDLEIIGDKKKMEMKIMTLFQKMDELGNYTNMTWFTSLDKYDLVRFFRELYDIWNYRANLEQHTKIEICPPNGSPFATMNISMTIIQSYNFISIKKNMISIIEQLITKGVDQNSRSLGCYYVLSALTLVSPMAAEALPWLYESVAYD